MLIDEIVDYAMKSKPLNLNMLREMVTDGLENGFKPSNPGIYETISGLDIEPSIKLLPLGSSVPEKYYGDNFCFTYVTNEPCLTPESQIQTKTIAYYVLGDNITAVTSSGHDVTEYIYIDDGTLYFTDTSFPSEYFEFDTSYVLYTNITVTCGNSSLTFVSGYYYGE